MSATAKKSPRVNDQKAGASSDKVEAVRSFRAKLDSMNETTLPLVRELNGRIQELCSSRPKRDPRRESSSDEDAPDTPIPTDQVDLDDDSPTPPKNAL